MSSGISFAGLGSGIDTTAIVKQLMALERRPVTLLQGRIDRTTERIAGLESLRGRLTELRAAERALSAAGAFSPKPWASSSDSARVGVVATASAVNASFELTVGQLARADVKTQSAALTASTGADVLHIASGALTTDVAVAAGDSIGTIADRINAANGGASATVVDGKLRLTARASGATAAIAVTSNGTLAADLALQTTLAGRDSSFTVDGTAYTRSTNTIADVVPGATLTLKATTSTAPLTVSTDPAHVDADGIVSALRTLVTAYNATIDGIGTTVAAHPDPMQSEIRARLQRATHGSAALGVSTGASTGTISQAALSGRLVLDESKLRAALASDRSGTEALAGSLASGLDAVLADVTGSSGALTTRIGSERSRIVGYQSSIDRMTVRLADRERLLQTQFAAMERSLGQLHDMQSRFAAQVGALAA